MDDKVWDASVFSKNRDRLIEHAAIIEMFNQVLAIANERQWLSGEHFSVDGTLIQAWAGHKSFVRKDQANDGDHSGEPKAGDFKGDFKGQKRSNATHSSATDGDARLYRKGNTASELSFMGHALSDNRHGLVASAMVTQANGFAEREAVKAMMADAVQINPQEGSEITLGADKGYDAKEFVDALDELGVAPHIAQNNTNRCSAVPDEIANTDGYRLSQQKRKRIEQCFGWAKMIGHVRQVVVRGLKRVDQVFVLTMAAYNLTRMRTLAQVRAQGV
jgi:hypothetical protein